MLYFVGVHKYVNVTYECDCSGDGGGPVDFGKFTFYYIFNPVPLLYCIKLTVS